MLRFTILDDERCLIIGKDFDNTLKKGVVYELMFIDSELIVKEIGENTHGKIKDGKCGYGYDMNHTVENFMGALLMSKSEREKSEQQLGIEITGMDRKPLNDPHIDDDRILLISMSSISKSDLNEVEISDLAYTMREIATKNIVAVFEDYTVKILKSRKKSPGYMCSYHDFLKMVKNGEV